MAEYTIDKIKYGSNVYKLIDNTSGYTKNTGTITGITMNGASKGTSGVVDLGTVLTAHQDISSKADKSATVSTVTWDTTNNKLTKTINGTTTDVVTVATLKTALGSMPASDVYNWAKASSKPSYTFSEIGSKPTTLSGYGITDAYTKTEVDNKVSSVLKYKGTKATVGDLPSTGNTTGDVWHVTANGAEYAWDGSTWQELGTAVDLSGYVPTSRTINSKALTGNITLSASDVGAAASDHTHTTSIATSTGTNQITLAHGSKYAITAGGTSYVFTMPSAPSVPTSAASATTGISISDHATTTITGVSGSTTVYGVKSGTGSTTTASKASGGNGTAPTLGTAITVYSKSSGSNGSAPSLTFAINGSDTNQLDITWSAGSASTWAFESKSIPNVTSAGSASTWSFTDVTVPIRADSATTVPTAASSATTVVTGKTHSITDNGHTHTLS